MSTTRIVAAAGAVALAAGLVACTTSSPADPPTSPSSPTSPGSPSSSPSPTQERPESEKNVGDLWDVHNRAITLTDPLRVTGKEPDAIDARKLTAYDGAPLEADANARLEMVVQLLGIDSALLTAMTQVDTRGGATDDCSLVLATGKERVDLAGLRPGDSGGAKCWRAHATDSHVTWTLSTLGEGISWHFFAYDRAAKQVSTLARYDFGQPAETELPDGGSLPIVLDGTAYFARPTEANNHPSERQIVAVPLSGGEPETIARGSDVFDFGGALGVLAGEGPIDGQPQATFAAQRAGEDARRPVPVVFGNLGKDTIASSPVVVGNTLAFVATHTGDNGEIDQHIFLVDLEAFTAQQIDLGPAYTQRVWLTDKLLVFDGGPEGPAGYVLERASGTLYRLPEDDLSGGAFLAPDGAVGWKTSDSRSDRQHVGRIATGTWAD